MLRLALAVTALGLSSFVPDLAAQNPGVEVPPASRAGVLAVGGQFVYVLRGDTVYQLDAKTLELLRTTELPPPGGVLDPPLPKFGAVERLEKPAPELDLTKFAKTASASIDLALFWLKEHQDEDGRWDSDEFMKHDSSGPKPDGAGSPVHDVGVTGLALLAFLGDGNTSRVGPHSDVVEGGVEWLVAQQDPNTGLLGSNAHNTFIYDHAIAALALVEAYGLTRDRQLESPAQQAVNYIERHRNPYSVWRYQPRDNDNDTSVTGWCAMTVRAARDFGLDTNQSSLQLARAWFDQLTDPTTGRTGYTERGGRSSRLAGETAAEFPVEKTECMTAIALCCRSLIGGDSRRGVTPGQQASVLLAAHPREDPEARDYCYWYWGSLAMFQVGGEQWKQWIAYLAGPLVGSQRRDGNFAGSWDPNDPWGAEGGRVYATAMATMALQAPARYARIVR